MCHGWAACASFGVWLCYAPKFGVHWQGFFTQCCCPFCLLQICRQADGFQPHLVSPERGIKRLVQEAMELTSPHVHRFVDEIHLVLMETVLFSSNCA
jgi:hypothetical protein